MGVQLGFMGVQLGGKVTGAGAVASRGRLSPRCPEVGASRCGCRSPALARGAVPAAAFAVSAGHAPGLRSRAALPPPLAREMPARQALGCVSLGW